MTYNETLKAAIDKYSPVMQSIVAMEELGELIQEISKQLRGKGDAKHLAEEIADVQIMLDQLSIMHDCSWKVAEIKAAKVARLRDRLGGQGMREILFRGKRSDTSEWVYGNVDFHLSKRLAYIRTPLEKWADVNMVFPDTVGQFTGLNDKNGKRIFEGDICKIGNLLYKVEFIHSCWWFSILSNRVYCCPAFNSHCGEYCEVIGNIHDNPELMEGN